VVRLSGPFLLVFFLVSAAVVVSTDQAAAACKCPLVEDEKIKVTLVVVLASEKPGPTDKCLLELADLVRKKNPKLKSFQVQSMSSESVAINQKTEFKLVDDKKAFIIIKHGANNQNMVKLSVHSPDLVGEVVYRSVCGKFLPIITSYWTPQEQLVIIAIRVQPCNGD
jgi:hypothetical protein